MQSVSQIIALESVTRLVHGYTALEIFSLNHS